MKPKCNPLAALLNPAPRGVPEMRALHPWQRERLRIGEVLLGRLSERELTPAERMRLDLFGVDLDEAEARIRGDV